MEARRLDGMTAVVTGGNTGIGRAIALLFRDEGARVMIVGRDRATLEATRADLGADGVARRTDVSSVRAIEDLFTTAREELDTIDVLVVSAGLAIVAPIEETDEAQFDEIVDVNLKGAFFTLREAIPLLNDDASVILIGSMSHTKGAPGYAVYSATKAALRSLARTAAAELVQRGIRVNTLSPGPTDTTVIERMGYSREQVRAAVAERNPMGRMAAPEEIARAALFLASADSSYMTGADLVVDGGQSQL